MNYTQKANPNATNSELDAKKIITHNRLNPVSLILTVKEWEDVIDALNTISYKYDDNNCRRLSVDLSNQLEVK